MWALEIAVFGATHAREVQGPWNVARKAADMVGYAISEEQPFTTSRYGLRIRSEVAFQLIGVYCMRHALHLSK